MPNFLITVEDKDYKRETLVAFGDTPLDAIFSCKEVVGKLVLSCLPLSCVKPA
jgi:hypothetical protein